MRNDEWKLHIDIEICNSEIDSRGFEDERFAQAIECGLRRDVSIKELADMCCQSISTFKRRFRTRYSMSPHKWFTTQKLELAYKILHKRDIAVVELTKVCGFCNASHFITLFRKRYGISPARLSKQLHNNEDNNKENE
ncbi:MAG: helix-turn-helix transcriptional regulator [Alistipes sp.]|nr:helix-turn-helix transcriptional regulator [Alistipes sp.]